MRTICFMWKSRDALGGCVLSGTTVWLSRPGPAVLPAGPHLPLPLAAWQGSGGREGLCCPDTGLGPVSRLSKCGPSYRGDWKTLAGGPTPGPAGRAAAFLRLRACCLGGAGASGGKRGRRPGRGRLPACQRERARARVVSGPSSLSPATARRASPASCRRRRRPLPPAAWQGCRLHRRGSAPFSRPLRLPGAHLGAIHFLPESSRAC